MDCIRIGITDGNREFFHRFRSVMMDQFPGEFELYLFPDLEKAVVAVEKFHMQVVFVEEAAVEGALPDTLPGGAVFFRLAETMKAEKDWEKHGGRREDPDVLARMPVLCRYRSADEWRRLLQRACAAAEDTDKANWNEPTGGGPSASHSTAYKLCLFTSAAGGTGTSTAAIAFAECCVRHSRRVLYANMESFNGTFPRMDAENLYTMEDIFLALRGKKYDLDAVLGRALNTDQSGIQFLLPGNRPQDLFDLSGEEILTFLDLTAERNRFSVVVLDMGFDASERAILPVLAADCVVVVSDGNVVSNRKTELLLQNLPMFCSEDRLALGEKTCLLYNRYRDGRSSVLQTEAVNKLGGMGEMDPMDLRDLTAELSLLPPMDRLYKKLMS